MLSVRGDLRSALLDAADRLIRDRGARGVTTREIAREAGCSDGALYVHFADKAHLLASLCERWLPDLKSAIGDLLNQVGADTVSANLEGIARTAIRSYRDMVITQFAIAGDPELLGHHRAGMQATGNGPRRGIEAMAAYLAAEQRLGRVRTDADCTMAAAIFLGACWSRAAVCHYTGDDVISIDDASYAARLATTLMQGLEPGGRQ